MARRGYCPSDYQPGDENDSRSPWYVDPDEDNYEDDANEHPSPTTPLID